LFSGRASRGPPVGPFFFFSSLGFPFVFFFPSFVWLVFSFFWVSVFLVCCFGGGRCPGSVWFSLFRFRRFGSGVFVFLGGVFGFSFFFFLLARLLAIRPAPSLYCLPSVDLRAPFPWFRLT
jgi:hypothetical protein